jgi:cell shape-determining protein MreD
MTWLNAIALLVVTYLVVFFQATFHDLRHWLGVQIDLVPGLVVYASLSGGIITVTLVSLCGGLWMDSLSANPLGVSVLPLFLMGLFMQRSRDFILRDQPFAQFVLGASGSAAASLFTLLIIINIHRQPLIGWWSLWQWFAVSLVGGAMTPVWFRCFDWIGQALDYRPLGESSFRTDREIKRGR